MDVIDASYPGTHAFRWEPRRGIRDLGVGAATAINESGQVAGIDIVNFAGFFWDPRTGRQPVVADSSDGVTGFVSQITGINDRAQVIGAAGQAFLWDRHAGARSLDTLNALSSDATDMNNRGQVVGRVQDALADVDHAYRWTRVSGMVDLTNGGNFAYNATSTAINEDGDVVGWTMTSAGPANGEAFLWTRCPDCSSSARSGAIPPLRSTSTTGTGWREIPPPVRAPSTQWSGPAVEPAADSTAIRAGRCAVATADRSRARGGLEMDVSVPNGRRHAKWVGG